MSDEKQIETNQLIINLIKNDVKEYDERLHEFFVLKLREQRTYKEKLNRKISREKKRQEKIDSGIEVRKRGRQPKYSTDDERKEAARQQRKNWYEKIKAQPD